MEVSFFCTLLRKNFVIRNNRCTFVVFLVCLLAFRINIQIM